MGAMLLALTVRGGPVSAEPVGIDRLVRSYPEAIRAYDGTALTWADGTRMTVSDGKSDKSFDERLRSASILDQMSLGYPKGPLAAPPGENDDPGRFRNVSFFNKMYGDCKRGEVQKHLVGVKWLPKLQNQVLQVTSVNGVAQHLADVSRELELIPGLKAYLMPSAGTFNCRTVKDTGVISMHAWGVAIDINTKFSDYWLWRKGKPYHNRIPYQIVDVFERHGFIWGGKWNHYDTMHFEYRPEFF